MFLLTNGDEFEFKVRRDVSSRTMKELLRSINREMYNKKSSRHRFSLSQSRFCSHPLSPACRTSPKFTLIKCAYSAGSARARPRNYGKHTRGKFSLLHCSSTPSVKVRGVEFLGKKQTGGECTRRQFHAWERRGVKWLKDGERCCSSSINIVAGIVERPENDEIARLVCWNFGQKRWYRSLSISLWFYFL